MWSNWPLADNSRPCTGASVSALTAIPLSAYRTQRAGFPHSALVRDHAFTRAKLRFRTLCRAKPQSACSLAFRKRTGFPDYTLCFRFPFVREIPDRGFDRNGMADVAGHYRTGYFSLAPTAHCLPKGRKDANCRSQRLRSPPDYPNPRSMNSPEQGVRSAARLGRLRSGPRWPTRALLALRAPEGERITAPSVTPS